MAAPFECGMERGVPQVGHMVAVAMTEPRQAGQDRSGLGMLACGGGGAADCGGYQRPSEASHHPGPGGLSPSAPHLGWVMRSLPESRHDSSRSCRGGSVCQHGSGSPTFKALNDDEPSVNGSIVKTVPQQGTQ